MAPSKAASSKAASCVDYDSAEDEEVPGTRKQANVAAKRTASQSSGLGKDKSDLAMTATELPPPPPPAPPTLPSSSSQEKNSDLASDSGYSSRTQTTTASADSVSSGRTSKTAKAPAANVAAPATTDGSAAAQPQPPSKGSRASSQTSSGKPKRVPCTDTNCDKCKRGRTLKPATPKKSAKSPAKSPPKQRPAASPNPKASGTKSAGKPQPETSDRARPLSRPRANSSAVPRPRSMYGNFPGAGPLIIPGGRPPVAYHHRYPVMPARPGYMNAGGQMMYPERPGMPRFSTDTAMVSTRHRPRPSSLIGTPVVTYDVNTGPKVSARRPTAKIQYPEPEEEETDESYDEQEEESEEEFEEDEDEEEDDDDPQPTLNKGGDALRQMLAGLDKRLELNRNVVAQAKAHQANIEARAAHLKAQEEAKRLVLVKAQEDAKRRAVVEEEAKRRTLLLKQLEEARRNVPPPAAPAPSSKYSMRTTSKPTHITYGNTAANDDDFEELRETIRNLGTHAATTQRRPSLAGSSDRTKASSYSHPSSSSTRLTVEHPTRSRRVSYVGSESRAELQQSLRELEEYVAARKREAATPALRQKKQAPADFHQFIQKAVEEKLQELNLDRNPATTQEDKIQAAIAYQRQLEREMNPFQVTPLTESALRHRQGILSEAGSSQQSSNESGTRISMGHRLTGPASESGGVKILGDEVRMRVDPHRGFEVEFEGRRLALNPTIDGLPELVITGRRETPYHSTRESTITTSKYGDTKSRAGGNKSAASSDRSATTVEDNRRAGAARLRRQLERERAEREQERVLERQLELEREERERERERARLREDRERERRQREEHEREQREREREQRQREERERERERRRVRDRADVRSEQAYNDYDSEYTRTGQMRNSRNSAAAKAAADARYAPGPSERDDYPPPRAASAWPRYTGPGYPGFAPQGFTAPGYGTANSGFQYGA